ncbi:hypothetical protein CBR_g48565 [Chara braunii]|uniref:Reverse transcriptase/retrotransposon-derived protein RNase H-like domain-containing protein n=1 Tax=Chara braunii TaxID=69332 RepID=A0A388M383_CHABU|nr:hypothetical protein CBR_g48565 [Chara braunii]|eukprot:GBG88955.1 hypothetical protein CBR_g48565 [Chara braunii]
MPLPAECAWSGATCDWVGLEITPELSYLWIERIWNPIREEDGWEDIAEGKVESVGTVVLSEQGWHLFCTTLAAGQNPMWLLKGAEARTWKAGKRFAYKGWDEVHSRAVMGGWKEFRPPCLRKRIWVPEFVVDWFGGFDHVVEVASIMEWVHIYYTWLSEEFYKTSLKYGPFHGDTAWEVLIILNMDRYDQLEVAPEIREAIIRREVAATPCYVDDVFKLFELVWQAGFEFADPEVDDVTANLRVAMAGSFQLPSENNRMNLSPFLLERLGGVELVRRAVADLASLTFEDAMVHREYYRTFLEMGPFNGEQRKSKRLPSRGKPLVSDTVLRTGAWQWQNAKPRRRALRQKKSGTASDTKVSERDDEEVPEGRENGNKSRIGGSPKEELCDSYNDFLRAFTLVALRIPGVTDRTMSEVSRPALPPQEAVVPAAVANRGYGRRDPANEKCRYCTMGGHFMRTCPRLNHDIIKQRCSRSHKGGPQGERINWNSPGGMRRAVILLNNLDIAVVEAEPVADIVWDQPRGREPQANFILEGNGQDRVNITTRRAGAEKKLIQDTVMEEVAGTSADQGETETREQEKVYGKTREEEPVDKVTAAKKKFKYQISILTLPEIDDNLSKLLGTMVSVSFQTMLQASPRLLKGLRQLLTRRRVQIEEAPEPQEQETEEAEAPQGVSNLQGVPGDLEDQEKAFAEIRLSLPVRGHHTHALVDGVVEITLIRRDFATITGCTVNKDVTGSIRGADREIPFAGYVTICAVKAGIRESIWSFQRITVMEEMDHDIILERPWCANVEIIGFAKIVEPIRAMIREGGTMEWTEDREAAVQTLKDILSSDQVTLVAPCFNDEVGQPFILETNGGPLAVGGVLIQRSEEGKERPIRFESRTLNSAERRYSQFKKEVLAILHCLKTFQAYLFGRRFILRIDPTNVVGALKNYKPIDPTVGRWIGFIWQFDYKAERIAGLRNREDGLSRICITSEGVEDAEPIDAFLEYAFLEYEGVTLVVDNEMADTAPTMDQLLIQTLEKGAPAIVAKLREGSVITFRRKDEKDSWGATMGPKEELMAMAVEGGRDAVMNLVETWTRRERQYLVNQAQEEQDTDQKGR